MRSHSGFMFLDLLLQGGLEPDSPGSASPARPAGNGAV